MSFGLKEWLDALRMEIPYSSRSELAARENLLHDLAQRDTTSVPDLVAHVHRVSVLAGPGGGERSGYAAWWERCRETLAAGLAAHLAAEYATYPQRAKELADLHARQRETLQTQRSVLLRSLYAVTGKRSDVYSLLGKTRSAVEQQLLAIPPLNPFAIPELPLGGHVVHADGQETYNAGTTLRPGSGLCGGGRRGELITVTGDPAALETWVADLTAQANKDEWRLIITSPPFMHLSPELIPHLFDAAAATTKTGDLAWLPPTVWLLHGLGWGPEDPVTEHALNMLKRAARGQVGVEVVVTFSNDRWLELEEEGVPAPPLLMLGGHSEEDAARLHPSWDGIVIPPGVTVTGMWREGNSFGFIQDRPGMKQPYRPKAPVEPQQPVKSAPKTAPSDATFTGPNGDLGLPDDLAKSWRDRSWRVFLGPDGTVSIVKQGRKCPIPGAIEVYRHHHNENALRITSLTCAPTGEKLQNAERKAWSWFDVVHDAWNEEQSAHAVQRVWHMIALGDLEGARVQAEKFRAFLKARQT